MTNILRKLQKQKEILEIVYSVLHTGICTLQQDSTRASWACSTKLAGSIADLQQNCDSQKTSEALVTLKF